MARFHINPNTGNPGQCKAVKQCRFGEAAHYSSKEEAREAYEVTQQALQNMSAENLPEPHLYEDSYKTNKGNSYSKMTAQPDGASAQTINGQLVLIHKRDADKKFRVEHNGKVIGALMKGKSWQVEYEDGSTGRAQYRSTDAIAALLKKSMPAAGGSKVAGAPKGYAPTESELNWSEDFRENKQMTLGRLRKLTNSDLVKVYNRVEIFQDSAHYGSEIQSDEAAKGRIEKVLAERGERIEVKKYGELLPGQDFSGPRTFGLEEKRLIPATEDPALAEKWQILQNAMRAR